MKRRRVEEIAESLDLQVLGELSSELFRAVLVRIQDLNKLLDILSYGALVTKGYSGLGALYSSEDGLFRWLYEQRWEADPPFGSYFAQQLLLFRFGMSPTPQFDIDPNGYLRFRKDSIPKKKPWKAAFILRWKLSLIHYRTARAFFQGEDNPDVSRIEPLSGYTAALTLSSMQLTSSLRIRYPNVNRLDLQRVAYFYSVSNPEGYTPITHSNVGDNPMLYIIYQGEKRNDLIFRVFAPMPLSKVIESNFRVHFSECVLQSPLRPISNDDLDMLKELYKTKYGKILSVEDLHFQLKNGELQLGIWGLDHSESYLWKINDSMVFENRKNGKQRRIEPVPGYTLAKSDCQSLCNVVRTLQVPLNDRDPVITVFYHLDFTMEPPIVVNGDEFQQDTIFMGDYFIGVKRVMDRAAEAFATIGDPETTAQNAVSIIKSRIDF